MWPCGLQVESWSWPTVVTIAAGTPEEIRRSTIVRDVYLGRSAE